MSPFSSPNSSQSASKACPFCETTPLAHPNQHHCGSVNCRMAWQRAQQSKTAEFWEDKNKHHKEEMKALYADWKKENSLEDNDSTYVEVPHSIHTLDTVNQERIDMFMDHIEKLLNSPEKESSETKFVSPFDTEQNKDIEHILPELCATCKGRCCNKGKANHAFIQRSTLTRVLHKNKDLIKGDLLELYRSQIPEKAIENSCIFHTDTGCCLDSDLKADICDEFFCLYLNDFIDNHKGKPAPQHTLAISTDESEIISWRTIPSKH